MLPDQMFWFEVNFCSLGSFFIEWCEIGSVIMQESLILITGHQMSSRERCQ